LIKDVFQNAPTTTIKGGAAKWAKKLGAATSLLNQLDPTDLTQGDVDILEEHFGVSPTKKLRKKVDDKAT
jgi:hypothetical protein